MEKGNFSKNDAAATSSSSTELSPPPPPPHLALQQPSLSSSSSSTSLSSSTSSTASSNTTAPSPRKSYKRQELSFAERIEVIAARTTGKSMRQLALQFGCGKTQILNILSQSKTYEREWEEKAAESNPHISSRKRRSRLTGNEEINRLVWQWYNTRKESGAGHISGPMVQREARTIAQGLGITKFAASNGWLDSFRRVHNIGSAASQCRRITSRRVPAASSAAPIITIDSNELLELVSLDSIPIDQLFQSHDLLSSASSSTTNVAAAAVPLVHPPSADEDHSITQYRFNILPETETASAAFHLLPSSIADITTAGDPIHHHYYYGGHGTQYQQWRDDQHQPDSNELIINNAADHHRQHFDLDQHLHRLDRRHQHPPPISQTDVEEGEENQKSQD